MCALSVCYLDKIIASVIGKIEGSISTEAKGKNGFGYDPIFIPDTKKKLLEKWNYQASIKLITDQKISLILPLSTS